MIINHNISALNTYRQLNMNQGSAVKSMEKLSSGFRINRAGDDAAGLAISEKMRGQIRGLNQAMRNAQDGISLIQTAEGALNETHAILQRMRELAVQSSTDTNTDADRLEIQKEITQLTREVDRIARTTQFNTMNLLDGAYNDKVFHIGANESQSLSVEIQSMRADDLGIVGTEPVGPADGADPAAPVDGAGLQISISEDAVKHLAGVYNVTGAATGDAAKFGTITAGTDFDLDGEYTLKVTASASGSKHTATLEKDGVVVAGGTGNTIEVSGTDEVKINGLEFTIADSGALPSAGKSIAVSFEATPGKMELGEDADLEAGEYTIAVDYDDDSGKAVATLYRGNPGLNDVVGSLDEVKEGANTIEGVTFYLPTASVPEDSGDKFEIKFDLQAAETDGAEGAAEVDNEEGDGAVEGVAVSGTTTVNSSEITVTGPESSAYNGVTIAFAGGAGDAGEVKAEYDKDTNTITVTLQDGENYSAADIEALIQGVEAGDLDFSEFTVAAASGFSNSLGSEWAAADDIVLGDGVTEVAGSDDTDGIATPSTPGAATDEVFDESTLHGINVDTQDAANDAIKAIDEAISSVSEERSKLGAIQNRLEHTIANLGTSAENLQAAEARIRDLDMAAEIMAFTKDSILQQAATAMLAQANMMPQNVLQLLR